MKLSNDGSSVLAENAALLPFLGDKTGAMPKGGSMERYHAMEWIGFINSEIHKSFSPLFQGAPDALQKAKAKEKILGRLEVGQKKD